MEATGIKKLVGSILQAEKKKKSGEICLRPYVFQIQYTHGTLTLSIIYCFKSFIYAIMIF